MTKKTKAGGFGIRGLMLDPARLTEKHEFYFNLLPQLAEWGFNTIWWHFVDDEGFVLKLKSHPELATPFAFTIAETKRFIAAAAEVGIDVVPEVETLGHANYITRLPQYAHLRDGTSDWRNACCPSQPETLGIMSDIITEVARIFPSSDFHAGLDEVDFSGCSRCARRGRGKPSWWIYSEHVKAIHGIVTSLGKRMTMWADHVESAPAMLKVLPKDIVMCHWQYRHVDEKAIRRSLDAGFKVVCAPSLCYYSTMIQPHSTAFEAMDKMTTTASGLKRRGVLGVVNTWWTPWRHLRDSPMLAVAYTGKMLTSEKALDKHAFAKSFCRDYFGLSDTAAARALWDMHELVPLRNKLQSLLFDSPADMMDAIILTGKEGFSQRADNIDQCVSAMTAARKKVTLHKAEYASALNAAKVAAACMNNGRKLLRAYDLYKQAELSRDIGHPRDVISESLAKVVKTLAEIQSGMDKAYSIVEKDWDRTRHSRDVKKSNRNVETTGCRMDSLLGRVSRCRSFSKRFNRFFGRLVKEFDRGGLFPTVGN